ncbi:MAG: GNAT family N-acetyltransferase [Spirochaetes bacterium]|nr:GNAT family N-acetyltransferase [Spirochaetota bacterium]
MNKIDEITTDGQRKELVEVIRKSNETVAEELDLTKENAPTNPAFLTYESLVDSMDRGLTMYGFYEDKKLKGCVGIEDAKKDGTFYIERLAVLPAYRRRGIGRRLLDFALGEIGRRNGKTASVAIINENETLKRWYLKYGFEETGLKKFVHLPFFVCFLQKKVE